MITAVDYCSDWHKGGQAVGTIHSFSFGVAGGLKVGAAKAGTTGVRETTIVIGRVKDLQRLRKGEQSLLKQLPNLGSPKANWQQNAGVLHQAMKLG